MMAETTSGTTSSTLEHVLATLSDWSSQPASLRVPVLDLRPEHLYVHSRLQGSCNIPLGELHRRMFALPPPTSPLAVILPSLEDYHMVATEPQQAEPGAAKKKRKTPNPDPPPTDDSGCQGGSEAGLAQQSQPVHLKGCLSVQDFMTTRGGAAVRWYLQDSPQMWEAARKLGLVETACGSGAEEPAMGGESAVRVDLLARLRRRFLFKPCPLLERQVHEVELGLAQRRFGRDTASRSAGHLLQPPDALRDIVPEAALGGTFAATAGLPSALAAAPRRRERLRLRCVEPGCGSGRNLAWLAAREVSVCLEDGTLVDISWDVVGLDFWYGALVRMQELCESAGFPPGQVLLHHCEIDATSGHAVPLPAPAASCKHHGGARSYIQPAAGLAAGAGAGAAEALGGRQGGQSSGGPAAVAAVPLGSETAGTDPVASAGSASPTRILVEGAFDLIVCVRFLHRAFNELVKGLLSPGGFILYNTFLDMEGTRAFGRPRGLGHLLQPGELQGTWFGRPQGFSVKCDEVELDEQFGRELTLFLASKD